MFAFVRQVIAPQINKQGKAAARWIRSGPTRLSSTTATECQVQVGLNDRYLQKRSFGVPNIMTLNSEIPNYYATTAASHYFTI